MTRINLAISSASYRNASGRSTLTASRITHSPIKITSLMAWECRLCISFTHPFFNCTTPRYHQLSWTKLSISAASVVNLGFRQLRYTCYSPLVYRSLSIIDFGYFAHAKISLLPKCLDPATHGLENPTMFDHSIVNTVNQ